VWLAGCSSSESGSDSDLDGGCEDTGNCAGASGTGGAPPEVGPVDCSGLSCQPLELPFGYPPVAACCAEDGRCGLDASFLADYGASFEVTCQARDQPGELDAACPNSEPVPVPGVNLSVTFEGCCRGETGTCGYLFDRAGGLIEIGLGCVDAGPFLDGAAPIPCGDGAGGAGG